MADKIIIIKEKKRGIGCGSIIIVALIAFGWWKFYSHINIMPRLTEEQRLNKQDNQRRMSVAFRLKDLEETHGHGRERLDKNVENAARLLYNTRHPTNSLPLVDVPYEQMKK